MIVAVRALQGVKRDGMLNIRRVEVDNVLYPSLRHIAQNTLSQVSVRVNQGQSVSASYVRDDHVLDQGGLPCASFPDDIHMTPPVLLLDAEPLSDVPVIGHSQGGDRILIIVFFLHTPMISLQSVGLKTGETAIQNKLSPLLLGPGGGFYHVQSPGEGTFFFFLNCNRMQAVV